MSDMGLSSINSIRPVDTGLVSRQPAPVQPDAVSASAAQSAPQQDKISTQEKAAVQEKSQSKFATEATQPQAMVSNAANISLKFRVDEETREVTIFVVDRSSKKVIRSIPPGELAKMRAGELLKLTA